MSQDQQPSYESQLKANYKDVRSRLAGAGRTPTELGRIKAIAEGQRREIARLVLENSRLSTDFGELMKEHTRIMDTFHQYVGVVTGCQKQRRILKR